MLVSIFQVSIDRSIEASPHGSLNESSLGRSSSLYYSKNQTHARIARPPNRSAARSTHNGIEFDQVQRKLRSLWWRFGGGGRRLDTQHAHTTRRRVLSSPHSSSWPFGRPVARAPVLLPFTLQRQNSQRPSRSREGNELLAAACEQELGRLDFDPIPRASIDTLSPASMGAPAGAPEAMHNPSLFRLARTKTAIDEHAYARLGGCGQQWILGRGLLAGSWSGPRSQRAHASCPDDA